ncbi:peptidase inhibitor family I36 protein [Streptomyces tsukubensis]|uniref:Proteinase inhibitor I36 SMPI n=1 Tax=Streptomyces tsukubensis TaxID=83656 RepID=A0A1V4A676_9ACTN|nr:peptidase inhibitor family I36 protein [Streptomyces tsukubensis]OON76670.1 hypothetical protein B1H18_20310 [Streptomyces tsukubensis]QFR93364.1 hypothetical protein GBW32_10045 [Streptomyces tsukubensis]
MRKTVTASVLALTVVALTPGYAVPAKATGTARAVGVVAASSGTCASGELCLWPKEGYKGAKQTYELAGIDIESCVPLPAGTSAQALANRTGRPVTTYQSAECAETGEFETYPGSGTWLPKSPYRVRAFKVWES